MTLNATESKPWNCVCVDIRGFTATASSTSNSSGVPKEPLPFVLQFQNIFNTPISSCARTLYTMKILRQHGVTAPELQYVRCLVGFTKASDRERIDNSIRWNVKSGLCPADVQSFGGLYETAEEKLFNQVLNNTFSISFFHVSLPQARKYNLRPRTCIHDKELSDKTTHSLGLILIVLTKCYLLTCTNSCMLFPHLSFLFAQQCSLCCLINEHDDDEEQTRYKKMEYDYLATYKKLWWQQFVESIRDAAYF